MKTVKIPLGLLKPGTMFEFKSEDLPFKSKYIKLDDGYEFTCVDSGGTLCSIPRISDVVTVKYYIPN